MNGRQDAPIPIATKSIDVGGVRLHLSVPDTTDQNWIGQDAILRQLLACWLVVDPRDLPLAPRLTGAPGIGKTTLAMAAARLRKQPLFINQCTADTRPEDLIITPVLAESGKIAYHASPLVSAMLAGGVCVLDEGNRMNPCREVRGPAWPRCSITGATSKASWPASRSPRMPIFGSVSP